MKALQHVFNPIWTANLHIKHTSIYTSILISSLTLLFIHITLNQSNVFLIIGYKLAGN